MALILISKYQSEERSHVTTMNLNPRLYGDSRRIELVAVADLLPVVADAHFYARSEGIENISDHSSHYKRV